jgi:CIC family chloride channel protein
LFLLCGYGTVAAAPLAWRAHFTAFHSNRPVLAFLLRLRTQAQSLFRFSEIHATLLWAAAIGFIGAGATVVFREGIELVQHALSGRGGDLAETGSSLSIAMRVLMPTCGGIAAGLLLLWSRRYARAGTHQDYMDSIASGDGYVPVRHTLTRSLSSLATIASGGSIGREGSMIQLAAMCASVAGRLLHFEPARLRVLVACGAAAGITAAYSAPIAGALFVTEIVLGSIAMESFGPIIIASVVSNITMRRFAGYQPPYVMPVFPTISGREIVLFAVLGIVAGLMAPQFLRLVDVSKRQFGRMPGPLPLRLGVGGLGVGILSIWVPQVYGNGYSVVNSILHQPWVWSTLLLVLGFKILATTLTVGSGAIGGIFTPLLFVGAAVGCLFGQAVHLLWPAATSAPFAYAIVGMGAFLAAASNAPLMAILMIFEMTLSYEVVLPLMLACVIAFFIARAGDGLSMYDVTQRRMREAQARLRLRGTRMVELIRPADTVLPLTASFKELTRMFLEYPFKYIYITDEAGAFCGVVALQRLTSAMLTKEEMDTKTAADFVQPEFQCITPDMPLADALQCFMTHNGERLPAIRSDRDRTLLGAVFKTSLLDAYFKMSAPPS